MVKICLPGKPCGAAFCATAPNGNPGDIYVHNNYTEAQGIIFQFNRFRPLRSGSPVKNLKDRSAGGILRYNRIAGGNSQICHYGGDSDKLSNYRKGTLFFHRNTLVSQRAGNIILLRLSSGEERVEAFHNIFSTTASGTSLAILDGAGAATLSRN